MSAIMNFDNPVMGNQLTRSELIVTLALLLKGNYYFTKAYVNFKDCRHQTKAMEEFCKACDELGIAHGIIKSDSCPYRIYVWNQNLKMLLAKQALLPFRFTWKNMLHIPESWIGTLDHSTLLDLLEFTTGILKSRDAALKCKACQIYDHAELEKTLVQLLRPVAPNIEVKYIDKLKVACVIGIDTVIPESQDDISDLL